MQVSHRPFWHFPPVLVLAGGDLAEWGGGGGLKNGDNCPHAAWVLNYGHCSPYNAFLLFFFSTLFFPPSLFLSHSQWQSALTCQSAELSQCRWLQKLMLVHVHIWVSGNVLWVVLACCGRSGGVGTVALLRSTFAQDPSLPLLLRHGTFFIFIFFISTVKVYAQMADFVLIQSINSSY